MNKNQIIAALAGLNRNDLAAVRGAADSLLGPHTEANQAPATPLFEAIARALGLRIGFAAFCATTTYKQFRRGEAAIEAFVSEGFPTPGRKVVHYALLELIVECLMEDLKHRRVPLSIGTLSSNLERAPQVFRDAFPGYIEGGLGGFIMQSLGTQSSKSGK